MPNAPGVESEPLAARKAARQRRLAALLVLVLTASVIFLLLLAADADRRLRADLLVRARSVASTIDWREFGDLRGDESDRQRPSYRELKEVLGDLRAAHIECRFLYVLGRRPDQSVFFFADSEAAGSPDESAAGETYEDYPPEVQRVFAAGAASTAGPYGDHWGAWFSAFVPLHVSAEGEVRAVLGFDIHASLRTWQLAGSLLLPIAVAMIALLGVLSAMMRTAWFVKPRPSRAARPGTNAPRPVGGRAVRTGLACGMLISIAALTVVGWQLRNSHERFERTQAVDRRLLELVGEIVHLDELLTMSARMSAATCAPEWRQRYEDHVRRLDSIIDEAMRLEPGVFGSFVAGTAVANETLVSLERRAFEWVELAEPKRATELLVCPEYVKNKQSYSDGVRGVGALLQGRAAMTMTGEERRLVLVLLALMGISAVLFLGWLTLSLYFRRSLVAEAELREVFLDSRRELEAQVQQRTAQLCESHAALQEQHARLEDVIKGTNIGTWEWEIDTGLVTFNERWAEIVGYRLDEIEPSLQTWLDLCHPDDLARSHELVFQHFAGETKYYDCELRIRHRDGHWVWVHDRGRVTHRNRVGEPIRMAGTHADITERKRAENALREAESRFRTLFQRSPDACMLIVEGRIADCNDASLRLLRAPRSKVIGATADAFSPTLQPDGVSSKDSAARHMQDALTHGTAHFEWRHRRIDGQEFWSEVALTALTIDGETILFASWRDISNRKRAEDELRRALAKADELNDSLEKQTAHANTLAQHAKQASAAKSAFLANMSHEIRTPMTAILGYSDLLLNEAGIDRAPPERREALHTIRRNGEHLLSIINDVLDLSKIEADKIVVEKLDCDPVQIAQEVVSLLSVRAAQKQVSLGLNLDGPLPRTFQTDPLRLRQTLLNLVGNAVKFTDVGGVHLTMRLDRGASDARIEFIIRDSGIGMSAEQIAHLFQPFSQADDSTTRRFGGTGLGLTISRRFAQLMGGDITVESQPNVGSTFTLALPAGPTADLDLVQSWPALPGPAAQPEKTEDGGTVSLTGLRVLLAEDGLDNQRLIAAVVRRAGAEVTLVDNGQAACDAALAAWRNGASFNAILMDMQMPIMDGYTATRLLRTEGYDGGIIALTAHAMSGDREKCLESGCDDYTTKPIDRRALLQTIQVVSRGHAAARP